MPKLNEQELLILCSYMYIDGSTETDIRLKELIPKLKSEIMSDNKGFLLSGGVSRTEALDIMTQIEQNERLANLRSVASINDNVRATCFVDLSDNTATLVYRGTGGIPEAWKDNLKGAYLQDTDMQIEAGNFFNHVNEDYEIKTVCGHSKGGNFAQYVTIVCDNAIENCVSFDGQGFSLKFHKEYNSRIKRAQNKICSISSFRDPINGLLKPLAGTKKYIKTKGFLMFPSHKSTRLLDNNLFVNGYFADNYLKSQSLRVILLNLSANSMQGSKSMSNGVGNIASVLLAGKKFSKVQIIKSLLFLSLKNNFKNTTKIIDKLTNIPRKKNVNQELISKIKIEHLKFKNIINKINKANLDPEKSKTIQKLTLNVEKLYSLTNSKNLKSSDLEISLAAIKKCNQQVQQISDFSQSIDKQKIPIDEKIKSLTSESKKDKSPLNREIQTPKKLPNNNIEKSI